MFILIYVPNLLDSLLTIFNKETGFYYVLLSLFVYIFYSKTLSKESFKITDMLSKALIIISPIFIYILIAFYLTGRPLPLLQNRLVDEISVTETKFSAQSFYNEYRSRKAPRDIYGYSVRTLENILGSLNISSIEYVIRYYFEDKKEVIKQNLGKYLFLVGVLVFVTLLTLSTMLLLKNLRRLVMVILVMI